MRFIPIRRITIRFASLLPRQESEATSDAPPIPGYQLERKITYVGIGGGWGARSTGRHAGLPLQTLLSYHWQSNSCHLLESEMGKRPQIRIFTRHIYVFKSFVVYSWHVTDGNHSLGATDLLPRSVLALISVQNHFYESTGYTQQPTDTCLHNPAKLS